MFVFGTLYVHSYKVLYDTIRLLPLVLILLLKGSTEILPKTTTPTTAARLADAAEEVEVTTKEMAAKETSTKKTPTLAVAFAATDVDSQTTIEILGHGVAGPSHGLPIPDEALVATAVLAGLVGLARLVVEGRRPATARLVVGTSLVETCLVAPMVKREAVRVAEVVGTRAFPTRPKDASVHDDATATACSQAMNGPARLGPLALGPAIVAAAVLVDVVHVPAGALVATSHGVAHEVVPRLATAVPSPHGHAHGPVDPGLVACRPATFARPCHAALLASTQDVVAALPRPARRQVARPTGMATVPVDGPATTA